MKKYLKWMLGAIVFMSLCSIIPIQAHELKTPIAKVPVHIQAAKTIKKSGGKYYGYRDGKLMKNTYTIVDGSYYYFNDKGIAITSQWKTINGKKYYFGSNGKAYTGAKKVGSYIYGFSSSGSLLKDYGYKKIDGKYYYFNKDGKSIKGFYKAGSYYRYFNGDGSVAKAQFKTINGKLYYFTKDGIMCTSEWKNIKNELGLSTSKFISCDKNGVVRQGLHEVVVDGVKNLYYFDKDLSRGVKTGISTINDKIYYFKAKGEAAKGLYKVGKYYYYFLEDGSAVRSKWVEVDKKRYYMASNGRSYVNIVKKVGKYNYYFTKYGYVQKGYKVITNDAGEKSYYYFNSKGQSMTGVYKIPDTDYSRYFNGDGTYAKGEFKEDDGNLYFLTGAGVVCQSEWRNIKSDLGINEAKYVSCDPETGVVRQGYTEVNRDGKTYTFYLDKDAQYGYRLGKQDCGDKGTYYFAVEHGNQGILRSGIITETETKSIYYCDPINKKMRLDGTYEIEGTDAYFDIVDGKLQFDTRVYNWDEPLTKFIKVCFSQMFKDYGHLSIGKMKLMDLDEIPGYSCSGYVLRMLYEVFGPEDIVGTNHDICYTIYEYGKAGDGSKFVYSPSYGIENLKVGDFVFINKDDCYESVDDRGEPMIIDLDEDGVCDREHQAFIADDGKQVNLHVHHVGIYIGNGMYINSMPGKGVLIQEIPKDNDEEYISAFARIDYAIIN